MIEEELARLASSEHHTACQFSTGFLQSKWNMSQIGEDGISAEQKFWNTPDLVEQLLLFLDAGSTMYLAQSHRRTLQILKCKNVWLKLIKRSCPYDENRIWPTEGTDLERKRTQVGFLVGILKMFDDEKSLQLELVLLGVLCTRFPAVSPYRPSRAQWTIVRCSYHNESHAMSPLGFLLQEDVESGLGTSKQKIERVWVNSLSQPLLASLSSRAGRQKEPLTLVDAIRLRLNNEGCADALSVLLKNCTYMDLVKLDVRGNIGTDGWEALGEALRSRVLLPWIKYVHTAREALAEARVEDLRTIWNAKMPLELGGGPWEIQDSISYNMKFLHRGLEDNGWERLRQIHDMSQDEFNADQSEEDEEDQDDDEDSEDQEDNEDQEGNEDQEAQ